MKKILSAFLASLLFLQNTIVFADISYFDEYENVSIQDFLIYELGLNLWVTRSTQIIEKIDDIIEHKSIEQLHPIQSKLEKILFNIKSTDWELQDDNNRIYFILASIIYQKIDQKIVTNLDILDGQEITMQDTQQVKKILTDLDYHMLSSMQKVFKNIVEKFPLSKYEKWNIKIDVNIDDEAIGLLNGMIEFKNIEATSNWLDAQLQATIKSLLQYFPKQEAEEIDFSMSGSFDMIQKNSDLFFQLKNLDLQTKTNSEIEQIYIKMLKKIENIGKYIKIPTDQEEFNKSIYPAENIITFFTQTLEREDYTSVFWIDEVEILKKIWNIYYLKQNSQKVCAKAEAFSKNIFWNQESIPCNERSEMYVLDMSNLEQISLSTIDTSGENIIVGKIYFNENTIQLFREIEYGYKNNSFISYTPNNELVMHDKNRFSLKIDFDTKWDIAGFDIRYDEQGEGSLNVQLKNNIITGNLELYAEKYNWESGKYESQNILNWKISGTTTKENTLDTLYITATGKNIMSSDALSVKVTYENNTLNYTFNYDTPFFAADLLWTSLMTGDNQNWNVQDTIQLDISKLWKTVGKLKLEASIEGKKVEKTEIIAPTNYINIQDVQNEEFDEVPNFLE